ncbi:L10-interacting MYB domain-containing protein-like [Nicotiana tomentosiformis]|uniref:L10-interacting MYB domain-containing protein-like n=1 Tax=Nicotiana tomentosiformis TaxID=4098 RepID=UPI00388C3BFD
MTLDNNSEKAKCDAKTTELFLNICVEEILAGNRPGTHFSRLGWSNPVQKFNDKTGRNCDKVKLKNKWDNLKDWWDRKIKENPNVEKFREKGLQHRQLMEYYFKDVATDNEEFVNIGGIEKNAEKRFKQTNPEESNVIEKVRDSESGKRRKRKASTAITEKEKNKFNTSLRIPSSMEKIAKAIQSCSSMNMGSKDSSLSIKYIITVNNEEHVDAVLINEVDDDHDVLDFI